MKRALSSLVADALFLVAVWLVAIFFVVACPLIFLYMKFVSKESVADQVAQAARSLLAFNDVMEAILSTGSYDG